MVLIPTAPEVRLFAVRALAGRLSGSSLCVGSNTVTYRLVTGEKFEGKCSLTSPDWFCIVRRLSVKERYGATASLRVLSELPST